MDEDALGLPGAEWVRPGLADLRDGRSTEAALLVAVGAPRLRDLGFLVPDSGLPERPEHALYRLLAEEYGDEAHGRYNALVRRLVSFERAAERARARAERLGLPAWEAPPW